MNDRLYEKMGITEEEADKKVEQAAKKARENYIKKIQGTKFSEKTLNDLKPFLKNAVFISVQSEKTDIGIGKSKIGGKPHLPEGFCWYRSSDNKPLTFLMQINLSEVHEYDIENILPEKGILYFFYDIENQPWINEDDENGFAVYYFDGDISKLSPADFPDNSAEKSEFYCGIADINCLLDEREISFINKNDLPSYDDFCVLMNMSEDKETDNLNYAEFERLMEEKAREIKKYDAAKYSLLGYDRYENCGENFKLLGYSDIIQNSILKEVGKDHVQLCQISTYDKGKRGVMFGDGGSLYFYISKEDLKNKRFDNVKISLQCY